MKAVSSILITLFLSTAAIGADSTPPSSKISLVKKCALIISGLAVGWTALEATGPWEVPAFLGQAVPVYDETGTINSVSYIPTIFRKNPEAFEITYASGRKMQKSRVNVLDGGRRFELNGSVGTEASMTLEEISATERVLIFKSPDGALIGEIHEILSPPELRRFSGKNLNELKYMYFDESGHLTEGTTAYDGFHQIYLLPPKAGYAVDLGSQDLADSTWSFERPGKIGRFSENDTKIGMMYLVYKIVEANKLAVRSPVP
jgi:hypothetical protein